MKKPAYNRKFETPIANEVPPVKSAKRVPIIALKLIRETSVLYPSRFITSPSDAFTLIKPFLIDADRENFYVIYLNTKNEPTGIHPVSIGTLNSSLVHPREVYKGALLLNASSVILSHNHPSGDVTPSNEDLEVSKRLKDAGDIMGINVLDHIIVGADSKYFSLKEHGYL